MQVQHSAAEQMLQFLATQVVSVWRCDDQMINDTVTVPASLERHESWSSMLATMGK